MSTPASSPATGRRRALAAIGATTGLLLATACSGETASVPPPGVSGSERDLSFAVDGTEVFATFTSPTNATGTVPAALIVSGSGPTDRDGNTQTRPDAGTNLNLARVLADTGVASLRYDKIGSGQTGLGDLDPEASIDPEVHDRQLIAAYEELLAQPGVDPDRTVVVGHSEGALFALRAHDLLDTSPALVLAAPPGTHYLDLVDRQLTEQIRVGEARGHIGTTDGVTVLSDARAGRAALRGGRELPDDLSPLLETVYSEQNAAFLRWIDTFDPVELAADLPDGTPVLVLWGEEDVQIPRSDVDRLMTGFADAERLDVPDADHVFREFRDRPGTAALDADRPFAPEVAPALEEFLDQAW
ncbi:alpha/beta hydrolase [Nocardiopsis sp. CNR-923]|uniref:alpha/beta hydrolase family protein n=1 Tax=Nocardiopsis sp. CNR-923 TaxID=1904965 RepID=UPI00095EA73B|nr:alpha/beta hydrolase [Nocardiopsis sp. CNR-923]OLT24998.1 alpha/beta hydrolase [Nocardiopsis sp. CNR-923]